MSLFTKEIQYYVDAMALKQPEDIDRMLKREGSCGSSFTVVLYARVDAQSAGKLLYILYTLAKEGKEDLETLKSQASDVIKFLGIRVKNNYHMTDAHTISMKAAYMCQNAVTHEELAELLRVVQRYYDQISYWIDFVIPWSQLSETYEKLQERKGVMS